MFKFAAMCDISQIIWTNDISFINIHSISNQCVYLSIEKDGNMCYVFAWND